MIDQVIETLRDDRQQALDRLFDFLRIPSVSTQSKHDGDCLKAAEWSVADLKTMGFDAEVIPTPGHPMVVATYTPKKADPKHFLFYGHYDVQPVDPIALWDADPFAPYIEDDKRIRARGSADDKGQLMTFIEACRAWLAAAGDLPCKITVLLEGEEESGSPSLEPFMEEYAQRLKADLALVCDTGMIAEGKPAITTMLRGMVLEEVVITGPNKDLHSGLYGGAARNPIRVLSKILAELHDDEGRIMLDGFYDGVFEPSAEQVASWQELGFSPEDFLGPVGLNIPAGETDRTIVEQIWSRPTCDVNGIIGGYTDEGTKTVLPSKASAKCSFRLVSGQDPAQVKQAFRDHVQKFLPADCQAEFISHGADPAMMVDTNLPAVGLAKDALTEAFGYEAVLMGSGGSIPVVEAFKRILGMDSLLVGFGLDDDQIHSPNEKYDLASFQVGAESWARILDKLSD